MTIEEAIKYCEEVAYQNEILMKRYDDASGYTRSHNEKIRTSGAKGCEQLISLYRQLAEWLRELKALKRGIGEMYDLLREPPRYVPNLDAYNRCLELVFKYVDNKDEIVLEVDNDSGMDS